MKTEIFVKRAGSETADSRQPQEYRRSSERRAAARVRRCALRHSAWGRPLAAAATAWLLMLAFATPSRGQLLINAPGATITGDRAAWHDLAAAFSKLTTMSYRAKTSAGGTIASSLEFSPPDSTHTIAQEPWGTLEEVIVGDETHYRMNTGGVPGTWRCDYPSGLTPEKVNQALAGRLHPTIETSRAPDTVIDGAPVHAYSYRYTLQDNSQTSSTNLTVYIDARTGLPRRTVGPESLGTAGPEAVTDFYDYGAPIHIALPACGTS